jgi:hypothetical protein
VLEACDILQTMNTKKIAFQLLGTATLAVSLFLIPLTAHAWDDNGHKQIADIAWTKLTPKAKLQITKILKEGEGRFQPFNSSEEEARDAFRTASTFSDYIKFTRTSKYEPLIDGMNKLFQPKPDPNDKESELCKTWHYYDTPIRVKPGTPAPVVSNSNAFTAMNNAIAEIKKLQAMPKPDRMRQCWWLYWIEHVVGDLHQPLHCVASYEFNADGDGGGNKFSIANFTGSGKTRLHGFWDGAIGRMIGEENKIGLSGNIEDVTARWSADPLNQSSTMLTKNLDIAVWIKEGATLADTVVYTGLAQNTRPSSEYLKAQGVLCKKQAVLGGTRLAAVLNQIFA